VSQLCKSASSHHSHHLVIALEFVFSPLQPEFAELHILGRPSIHTSSARLGIPSWSLLRPGAVSLDRCLKSPTAAAASLRSQ